MSNDSEHIISPSKLFGSSIELRIVFMNKPHTFIQALTLVNRKNGLRSATAATKNSNNQSVEK